MNRPNLDDDCPVDLIPTRSSLLGRLKDWEDHESWRVFFDTYWRLIYNFAIQRGLNHEESQEVVQETVVAVAKHISKFRYDREACAFKTWLLSVTRSKIANQLERRARQPVTVNRGVDDSSGTDQIERLPKNEFSPWEQAWDAEWQRNLTDAAIRRAKRRVPIEQFQMFDLFVVKQWPARDVARTLKVTIGHVYVAKHRISKMVRKEIEALEKQGV
jgi:RNA polymerase sigma-70 factor (ECF subfamily)